MQKCACLVGKDILIPWLQPATSNLSIVWGQNDAFTVGHACPCASCSDMFANLLMTCNMMNHINVVWLTGVEWGSESSIEDPTNGVKFQLPDPLIVLASFGLDANFLTQNKGQCSYLQDHQNEYLDNVAQYAGGIMYSTDRVSLYITCKERAIADNGSLDCGLPSWGGNNIAEYGYGPVIAFPPAKVNTDLPSALTYVSNGVSKLSITAQVSDEAGTHITTGVAFQNDLLIDQYVRKSH